MSTSGGFFFERVASRSLGLPALAQTHVEGRAASGGSAQFV